MHYRLLGVLFFLICTQVQVYSADVHATFGAEIDGVEDDDAVCCAGMSVGLFSGLGTGMACGLTSGLVTQALTGITTSFATGLGIGCFLGGIIGSSCGFHVGSCCCTHRGRAQIKRFFTHMRTSCCGYGRQENPNID